MLSDLGTSSQEISETKKLYFELYFSSVQKLNRVLLFVTTWTAPPSFRVHHQLLELAQIHFHWVGDASQPSHPLSPHSSAFKLFSIRVFFFFPMSQFCASAGQSIRVSASSCFQWISGMISFRIDWLDLLAVLGILKSLPTPQLKSINSSGLSLLYGPTLTSIRDYWKNHSFDYMDLCCCWWFYLIQRS